MSFTDTHLKSIRVAQKERNLCWAVGRWLQIQEPDIFNTLTKEVLAQPTTVLASLLYHASALRKRYVKRIDNLKAVDGDNAEALEALRQVREGLKD